MTDDAAVKKEPAPTANLIRERVFKAIEVAGARGLTDQEVAKKLGVKSSTARARRVDLWKSGRVCIRRSTKGDPTYRNIGSREAALIWVVGEEEQCPHCGAVSGLSKNFRNTERAEEPENDPLV